MFIHAYTKCDGGYINDYIRINGDNTWDRLISSKWIRLGTPSPTISETRAKVIKFYGRRWGNVIESAPCLESFVDVLARETYREPTQHPKAIQELMNACDANDSPRCQAALRESILRKNSHKFTVIHDDKQLCLAHDMCLTFFGYGPLPETQLPRGDTTFDTVEDLLTYLQNHDAPEILSFVKEEYVQ